MIAYVDTFSMGDNVQHHVDTSWKPAWSGTNQIRHFVIEGDTLTMTAAPYKSYLDGRFGPVHTGLDQGAMNGSLACDRRLDSLERGVA